MASKGTSEQMTNTMVDNKIADENLNMNQFQSAKPAANRVSSFFSIDFPISGVSMKIKHKNFADFICDKN